MLWVYKYSDSQYSDFKGYISFILIIKHWLFFSALYNIFL